MTEYFKEIHLFIEGSLRDYYSFHSFQPAKDFSGFINRTTDYSQEVSIGPSAEYESFISYHPYFRVFNKQLEHCKVELLKGIEVLGGTMFLESQGDELARRFGVTEYSGWSGYTVNSKEEAETMVNHHKEFMDKVGWQFFEMTSTLGGISKYLNSSFLNVPVHDMSNEDKIKAIRKIGAKGMINGVAAAWLIKEREFEKLVLNYRAIFFPEHIQKTLDTLLEGMQQSKKS